MAMTIDCNKLLSMSGCVTPPPPAVNLNIGTAHALYEEEVATPKLVAGAGQMDGIMADALNSKLQQLQAQMFQKSEEARIVPGLVFGENMNLGDDFVKVPLPGQQTSVPVLLPPPQPHSVQRPPKDPRFRPIPDRANVVISKGSVGHPFSCAAACKYVKRKGGCRDGADCLLCHECFWSKASTKDGEKRQDEQVWDEEHLSDKFVRLLSNHETQDARLPATARQVSEDSYLGAGMMVFPQGPFTAVEGLGPAPGLELPMPTPQINPGSMGHPFSCGPACKYVLKTRGCKDGDMCTHCHLCRWTRYSAKTLKL